MLLQYILFKTLFCLTLMTIIRSYTQFTERNAHRSPKHERIYRMEGQCCLSPLDRSDWIRSDYTERLVPISQQTLDAAPFLTKDCALEAFTSNVGKVNRVHACSSSHIVAKTRAGEEEFDLELRLGPPHHANSAPKDRVGSELQVMLNLSNANLQSPAPQTALPPGLPLTCTRNKLFGGKGEEDFADAKESAGLRLKRLSSGTSITNSCKAYEYSDLRAGKKLNMNMDDHTRLSKKAETHAQNLEYDPYQGLAKQSQCLKALEKKNGIEANCSPESEKKMALKCFDGYEISSYSDFRQEFVKINDIMDSIGRERKIWQANSTWGQWESQELDILEKERDLCQDLEKLPSYHNFAKTRRNFARFNGSPIQVQLNSIIFTTRATLHRIRLLNEVFYKPLFRTPIALKQAQMEGFQLLSNFWKKIDIYGVSQGIKSKEISEGWACSDAKDVPLIAAYKLVDHPKCHRRMMALSWVMLQHWMEEKMPEILDKLSGLGSNRLKNVVKQLLGDLVLNERMTRNSERVNPTQKGGFFLHRFKLKNIS